MFNRFCLVELEDGGNRKARTTGLVGHITHSGEMWRDRREDHICVGVCVSDFCNRKHVVLTLL